MNRTFSNGLTRWSFRLERIRDHHWNNILANQAFTTLWLAHSRSRWPRTIRIRKDASVTTAKPAIAVARDQVVNRVADQPRDEVKDPCPLPVWKLARNAQRGFRFYIGLAGRDEREGIRAIRIDAELLSERTTLGQLDRNVAKEAAAISFADEAATARA
jgi:hypothetical protein